MSKRKFFFIFLIQSFALLAFAASTAAAKSAPFAPIQTQILSRLQETDSRLSTFKAFCSIGIPHSEAPLIQWVNGLIAYRANPEFLYVKGFKPLQPLYFVLKSSGGTFQLFFPRSYKVFSGANAVTHADPDLDMKLNAGDLLKALASPEIPAGYETGWGSLGSGTRLTLKNREGKIWRELDFDAALRLWRLKEFNGAGFPSLEITKSGWRVIQGTEFPFEIKIKRFLPNPSDLVLVFREIRTNEPIEERILNYEFPPDAETIKLA